MCNKFRSFLIFVYFSQTLRTLVLELKHWFWNLKQNPEKTVLLTEKKERTRQIAAVFRFLYEFAIHTAYLLTNICGLNMLRDSQRVLCTGT